MQQSGNQFRLIIIRQIHSLQPYALSPFTTLYLQGMQISIYRLIYRHQHENNSPMNR